MHRAVEPAPEVARLPREPAAGVGRGATTSISSTTCGARRCRRPATSASSASWCRACTAIRSTSTVRRGRCHLIEGLEGGRFAMYVKVHHALVDGFTRDADPVERAVDRSRRARPPAVLLDPAAGRRASRAPEESREKASPRASCSPSCSPPCARSTARRRASRSALMNVVRRRAPKTTSWCRRGRRRSCILNAQISRNRRFATQQFETARLKAVAKAVGGTLNDVVLALSAAQPAPLPRRARRAAGRAADRDAAGQRARQGRRRRRQRGRRDPRVARHRRRGSGGAARGDRRVDDARQAAAAGHVEGGDPPVQRAADRRRRCCR